MGCLPSKPEDDPQTSAVDALIESFRNDAFQILRQMQHIESRSGPTQPSRAERYRELRYRCMATLSGHTYFARRRRPLEHRVDCSSTPRGAQVECVTALPNDRVVSGSLDNSLRVWDASTSECIQTLRQTEYARRLRPA